jgi:cardiolipin synthase
MEAMYIDDLGNATEILIERRRRVRTVDASRHPRRRGSGGSATRAAAGALRIGNAIGSALVARQVTGPAERRLFVQGGSVLALIAVVAFFWPPLLAWPVGALSLWLSVALLLRAARQRRSDSPAISARRGDGP